MKKNILCFTLSILFLSPAMAEDKKVCSCKCTVKEEDGSYSIKKSSGANREIAGENLKKNLKKQKCELSPVCTGSCDI